jgi:hypothetical protein
MSLLDDGAHYEPCNVYKQILTTDRDGNKLTKASATPTPATGRFQVQNQSGTSSRLTESDKEGYTTEQVYSVRFPRAWEAANGPLGPQSEIGLGLDAQGREARWQVFGFPILYTSSPETTHKTYTIRRT